MRCGLVLHWTEPEADVKIGCVYCRCPKPDGVKDALGPVDQLFDKEGANAGASGGPLDVNMPQTTNPVLICIRIAIEATYCNQIGYSKDTEKHLSRPRKSVCAGVPFRNEPVYKVKPFPAGFSA